MQFQKRNSEQIRAQKVGNLGEVQERFRRSGGLDKEAEKDQADFGV